MNKRIPRCFLGEDGIIRMVCINYIPLSSMDDRSAEETVNEGDDFVFSPSKSPAESYGGYDTPLDEFTTYRISRRNKT